MQKFDDFFTSRKTEDILEKVAVTVCSDYIPLITNNSVCYGAVHEMGDIILPVIAESLASPDFFCSEFLGYCDNSSFYKFDADTYV